MLSKTHAIVLGIIKESPINPYRIIKLFDELHVKDWLPYADSSIYASINALVKKNYIEGTPQKNGRMPDKAVYTITEDGVRAFEDTLRSFFSDITGDHMQFTIAILFICHLGKGEIKQLLNVRLQALEAACKRMNIEIEEMKRDSRIPPMALMTIKHHLHIAQTNIKTAAELSSSIDKAAAWDSFLSHELI